MRRGSRLDVHVERDIHEQRDGVVLAVDALQLIVRASEGVFLRARNRCVATVLEAVRDRVRSVDLTQVNRVLMQPHWRHEQDILSQPGFAKRPDAS